MWSYYLSCADACFGREHILCFLFGGTCESHHTNTQPLPTAVGSGRCAWTHGKIGPMAILLQLMDGRFDKSPARAVSGLCFDCRISHIFLYCIPLLILNTRCLAGRVWSQLNPTQTRLHACNRIQITWRSHRYDHSTVLIQ